MFCIYTILSGDVCLILVPEAPLLISSLMRFVKNRYVQKFIE